MKRDLYPVTITSDRYTGSYSGGRWTAFWCDADCVPRAPAGGDGAASDYWCLDPGAKYVGRGDTPAEALEDLHGRITSNLRRKHVFGFPYRDHEEYQ